MNPTPTSTIPLQSERIHIRRLQELTIAWMIVEVLVSLSQGIRTHSVSLGAFGLDSVVELLSAAVVLFSLQLGPHTERRAASLAARLLYALAACIVLTSLLGLFKHSWRPEPTRLGVALLIAAGIVMPMLGRAKKRLAQTVGNRALRADAAQSNLCAWMAWIAAAGLFLNAVFGLWWADSLAALLLLPIVLTEANVAR
jgi:divalent metal cation (Fe/Co/Zn/Cd) transporter